MGRLDFQPFVSPRSLPHTTFVERIIVRLSTAKAANAEPRLVVCRSVRDVCLFKLPDDTAELGTSVQPRAFLFRAFLFIGFVLFY